MGHCPGGRTLAIVMLMAGILLSSKPTLASGPWKGYATVFTFTTDDGNKDNLAWTQEFASRGLSYTAFVVPTQLGTTQLKMTEDDVRYLHQNGIEIGSHGLTHIMLTGIDDNTLLTELNGSCAALEAIVQDPNYHCRTLGYPEHAHDLHVMAVAESLGFTAARDGGINPLYGHPYTSLGNFTWTETGLYELPLLVTYQYLVGTNNSYSEELTRAKVDTLLYVGAIRNYWVNIYAHRLFEIDAAHMGWILDEMLQGDVWVDNVGVVADYYRGHHGLTIPVGVIPPSASSTPTPANEHTLKYLLGGDPSDEDPPIDSSQFLKSGYEALVTGLLPPVFTPGVKNMRLGPAPVLRLPSPNPAHGHGSTLRFSLPRSTHVTVQILDVSGRQVRLLTNEVLNAGDHEVFWDGLDAHGAATHSGIFLYHLQTPGFEGTKKITLLP
jgi:peptidoglycan/xylan/chitin deacetylase (PgdA/CDA1 family)